VLASLLRRAGLTKASGRTRPKPVAAAPRTVEVSYAPHADGDADPGEVVWGWVPFEDDPSQGKDRPVLVVARRPDGVLLTLMLTSKDHDRDAADEARWGRYWMDVGAGGWDRQHRPSEVRLDRLIELRPADVRREGAALPKQVFDRVVSEARRHHALP